MKAILAKVFSDLSCSLNWKEMTIRCLNCGHEEPDGEKYCGQCGRYLDDAEDVEMEFDYPVFDEEYYYTYEWFGELHRIRKWKWDLSIVSMVGMGVVLGLVYLGIGLWVNALLFFFTMCLAAFLQHIIGKRKYGIGALYAVGFFVVLPGLILASVPWQALYAEYLEEKYEPKFSDTITYNIQRMEDSVHITCDGEVINYGRTGSRAIVEFKAYGGSPLEGQELEMLYALAIQKVTTNWIAPDGGSAHVHWECNLSYFNGDGRVYWLIEPYP